MKRKLLFILCVFVATISLQAQPRSGTFSIVPRVGLNLANITDNEVVADLSDQSRTLSSRIQPGLAVGVDAEWQATDRLFFSLGGHYSRQGSRYPDFERTEGDEMRGYSDWHTNLDYVNVPLLVGCRIIGGLSVKAGVQMGMLVNAKSELSETEIIPLESGGREQGSAVSRSEDLMDACKKTDISIPVGISYEYENVVIDARYCIGVSRIYELDVVKSRNSVVQLSVGYRFQL
ncbi:MAG: PorT family protein [Prevotella sp.]|nr:PorT family protein [Prevotella sp.]